MSNEFNLERAKAGEPVEFRSAATSTWEPVYFVGLSNSGAPVIEMHGRADVFKVSVGLLRMAPKKVKARYRVAVMKDSHGGFYTIAANHDDEAVAIKGWTNFVRWLTDWIEAEITE